MCDSRQRHITDLLKEAGDGRKDAAAALLPLVYVELRNLAAAVFSDQNSGHTLQPTALVHEAWIKLAGGLGSFEDRQHFFVVAAKAMRQVLTDHARGRNCQKRGGGRLRVTLDTALAGTKTSDVDLLSLEDALTRLESLNPRHAEVVELRLFGALTIAETADRLNVSHGTVESDWAMAKAWLRKELAE